MTQRFISLFSFLCLLAMAAFADNQEIEINLNEKNGYSDTTSLRDAADLYVTAILDNSNDQAQIKLKIKNQTEKYGLLLFNRNYTEKDTKSKDWKKEFFEINWENMLKNKGPVEATTDLTQPVFFIDLSETCVLPIQKIIGNGEAEITLAIYVCEITKRNKQSQPQKVKMKFDEIHPIKINLELGPDTEFELLKEGCDDLIKTINNLSFCPCEGGSDCKMKKHHPNLDGQVKELEQRVGQKNKEIRDIARNHGSLVNKEIEKSKYQPLIDDIQKAFNAKVEDITNHPEKLKKCKYCSLPRTCKTCGKPLGNGKKGTCTGNHPLNHCKKCRKVISKGATYCEDCKGITWKQAKQEWEDIYKNLKNKKKNYTCQKAKRDAGAIYKKVKGQPDDGCKNAAMNSYNNIQKYCK